VLILGLGEIGLATARKLASVGFNVSGWSRTPRDLEGVTCVAGKTGYLSVLPSADIVVCLLPLTYETRGLLAQPFFAQMKHGAAIVHAGRGGQCVFPDLADALRSGQIGNAVLDVFETEPLPATDESWAMPNCLITPHVAGRTDARTAAENVSKNLLRLRAEEPLLWRVDRTAGY
jgi:glyoxylate/hydroxypyruvate reductase A